MSRISHTFGGSATSTPRSSTFTERARTRPSAKTVRVSILPSRLRSSSTTTRPIGSCSFEPVMSAMKPGISTAQSRPAGSQSIATGS